MTNTERLLEVLEQYEDGLCDDCLAEIAEVKRRQQVNQICRRLAQKGLLLREQGVCSSEGKRKIVNRLKGVQKVTVAVTKRGQEEPPPLDIVAAQRGLVAILDAVEGRKARREEGTSARIGRLLEADMLPSNVAIAMRTLNSFRNLVVHEGYQPTDREHDVLSALVAIVEEWAGRKLTERDPQGPTAVTSSPTVAAVDLARLARAAGLRPRAAEHLKKVLERSTRWQSLSEEERLLVRQREFLDEIERRSANPRDAWARIKTSHKKIFDDEYICSIARKTLKEERLTGKTLGDSLERMRRHLVAVERRPIEVMGGLPERNRRKF